MQDTTRLGALAASEAAPRLKAAARLLFAAAECEWDQDAAVRSALTLARRAVAILDGTDEHVS